MTQTPRWSFARPHPDSPLFDGILGLARRDRRTVGFLPNSAFKERAQQGTLLALVDGDDLGGYVLYDLPRDEIRIVQLVVASEARGQGHARRLVDRVAESHADRRGILLHCRNDFPANSLWPSLGFTPLGERPGRSFDGKPLTRWFRSFGKPDLFTLLEESDSRPVATMDSCVFIDLVAESPGRVARQLRADWLGEHVRLAVTDHVLVELQRGVNPEERRRQHAAAEPFRLPTLPEGSWKPIFDSLVADHPDVLSRDLDDLKHVAQSIALQADWLVTTDGPFRTKYRRAAAAAGNLQLIAPAEFLRTVDEQARGDRYRPVELSGTSVRVSEVRGSALAPLASLFVNNAERERMRDLRAAIEFAAARPESVRLELVEVAGEPRALICWELTGDALEAKLLRATRGRGETAIGRQLLGRLRDQAVLSGRETVRVVDGSPSPAVQRSYRDEGFAAGNDGVVAHALAGVVTFPALLRRAEALESPAVRDERIGAYGDQGVLRAAALERWFAPVRVVGAGIPTYVVPIKHSYATELFDAGLSEGQLFEREWQLGLRRELVYYRSPQPAPRGFAAPARLLWYVSGGGPGAGHIRAASHLTEVAVDESERLFYRLERLGVYTRDDVLARADRRGRTMALRFTNTELFDRPVTLDEYRQLVCGDAKSRRVTLQSPQPVSEHVFVSILELGRRGHG